MSSKGYRQPFSISMDGEVFSYIGGRKRLEWVAPDYEQAREYCDAAIMEWQVKSYGNIDPYVDYRKLQAAMDFGFDVPPDDVEATRLRLLKRENAKKAQLASGYARMARKLLR